MLKNITRKDALEAIIENENPTTDELTYNGQYCAIGAVLKKVGVDFDDYDEYYDDGIDGVTLFLNDNNISVGLSDGEISLIMNTNDQNPEYAKALAKEWLEKLEKENDNIG